MDHVSRAQWPPVAIGYPVGQRRYGISPSLEMELGGTLGADHSARIKMDSHCSCSQELRVVSVLVPLQMKNVHLIAGGYLGTVTKAGDPCSQ